jgi:hypothetical protein
MEISVVRTNDLCPFLYVEIHIFLFASVALYFVIPAPLWRTQNLGITEMSHMHPVISSTMAK